MFAPGVHTEIEEIAGYLELQLDALRSAAHGLTDEQARMTPCRSRLSVGGLLKHTAYVCTGRLRRKAVAAGTMPEPDFAARMREFSGSFVMTDDETLEDVLAAFDAAAAAYLADVRASDPDARVTEPPAPWFNRPDPVQTKDRYALLHHIEELARHAGHADVIREQIDGALAPSLAAAVHHRPANAFVTPWQPATA